MVTRSALQNAASIAKNILTTEAIVAEPPEEGGAGGMPRWHAGHGRDDVGSPSGLPRPGDRPHGIRKGPGDPGPFRVVGARERPTRAEQGFLHCGPHGGGHFVKMVHNGIEYGLMAAYAEGLNILKHANVGNAGARRRCRDDAAPASRVLPLRDEPRKIAEVWRRGSVISSWLLDLTAAALHRTRSSRRFTGRVSDSGEGRWTIEAAIDEGVPAHVLSAALFARFSSRGAGRVADQVLSAMRQRVRRPRREAARGASERGDRRAGAGDSAGARVRRARLLRLHRRPREQEDLPGALRDGAGAARSTCR